MKKTLFLVVCLLMVSAMVFAGGGRQSDDGTITLTVWDFKSHEEPTGPIFREMDRQFEANNPGVKINRVAQPETTYYQLLLSAFRAGTAVDVVLIHPDNRAWNLADYYEVLDRYIANIRPTYNAASLKASSPTQNPNGNTRMLPLTQQGMGMYYNKANFRRAGLDPERVPRTWNEFLAACEALKNAGIPPIIFGNPHGVDFIYRVILATLYGPDRIEGFRDGRANFTDPEYRLATQMIKELFDRGYVNTEAGSISYFTDAIEMFKSGRGGFFAGLNSDIANWFDFGTALGFQNVGYFNSPIHPTAQFPQAQVNQGAGIGYAVVNYSKNKDLAVEYVKHATSGVAAKAYLDGAGALIPNSTVPVDPNNELFRVVLNYMGGLPVNDIMNIIPGGMETDYHNFMYLFFYSNEITLDNYINQVQQLYRSLL